MSDTPTPQSFLPDPNVKLQAMARSLTWKQHPTNKCIIVDEDGDMIAIVRHPGADGHAIGEMNAQILLEGSYYAAERAAMQRIQLKAADVLHNEKQRVSRYHEMQKRLVDAIDTSRVLTTTDILPTIRKLLYLLKHATEYTVPCFDGGCDDCDEILTLLEE